MRCALFAAVLVLAVSCGGGEQPPVTDSTDTRMPIAVEYVSAPELPVHARAEDAAPVISTYGNGESVSVLASGGNGWVEVRTANGTGWAHAADLRNAAEAKAHEEDNLTPRFRKAPSPVTQTTARGEIVLEAAVNTDGDVTSVRTLSNTTGSMGLEAKNRAELEATKFFPIVQKGQRIPFTYEYRVHY
jgi:TonB family protein